MKTKKCQHWKALEALKFCVKESMVIIDGDPLPLTSRPQRDDQIVVSGCVTQRGLLQEGQLLNAAALCLGSNK